MAIEVTLSDGTEMVMKHDEGPREDTAMEKLSTLKVHFKEKGN